MTLNSQIKLLNQWRDMPHDKLIRSTYLQQWLIEILDKNSNQIEKHHMHAQYSDYQSIRLKELNLTNQHYPLLIDFFSNSFGVSFYQNDWFFSLPCSNNQCVGLKIKLTLEDDWLGNSNETHIDLEIARLIANKVIDISSYRNKFFCLNCISEKMHRKENQYLSGEWVWFDTKTEMWQLRTMLGERGINLPLELPAWTAKQDISQELNKLCFAEQFSDIYNWENDDQL